MSEVNYMKKALEDIKLNIDDLISETKSKLDILNYEQNKQYILQNNIDKIKKYKGIIEPSELGYIENENPDIITEYANERDRLEKRIIILIDLRENIR